MTGLQFDNTFVRELDGLYERWSARTAPDPDLVVLNDALAQELGADPDDLRSPAGVDLLVGNAVPAGADPVAQAYAGHQFGGYSPRLGDGRALLLGEVITAADDRVDLHLKGSGRTPFARGGDGLAALAPMLREYLMCEAMHALGVPTTRGLAVVATGDSVTRETLLPGAVFVRVASSHLRVGTFQYAASLDDPSMLARLIDHSISRHAPSAATAERPALALLDAVIDVQADLIARWMSIGFIHGVMNTDNMTISGETIDYGPCAFMDVYDPATVFSSIDHGGRYAFGNQPQIGLWNLARLAETLLAFIDPDQDTAVELATGRLEEFPTRFRARWSELMATKLGLAAVPTDDAELADDLLAVLHESGADFTSAFRSLSAAADGDEQPLRSLVGDVDGIDSWLERWQAARAAGSSTAVEMNAVNPIYVPRNHLVDEALNAATTGDLAPFTTLLDVLQQPFTEQSGRHRFAEPAPADFASSFRTFCGT
ncbi:protein adenylyltransferase SelO [Ilumatobacter nonamiensis]|uniref:protein adenylyltransferase SelO n=1 Tax=Ilumatobacter nonamiensis TaxID=467093 RepID=UPI00058BF3FE|nr:YdiU family protein [Ilumatobacter nonamiensis]